MKIRTGFVSNSSSTSFTCCICGNEESGMDMSASDAGMTQCSNGHTFCENHALDSEKLTIQEYRNWFESWCNEYEWRKDQLVYLKRNAEDFMEWFEENDMEDTMNEDGVSPLQCPICQFKNASSDEIAQYYLKSNNLNVEQFASSMKEKFGTYNEFKKYISNKKGN